MASMRVRGLPNLIVAALVSVCAMSSSGAPIWVRDWTIDTPIGRFGYAEIDSTLVFQVGPGPHYVPKFLFLGPLGEVSTPFSAPMVAAGAGTFVAVALALGVLLIASQIRKRKHDPAAEGRGRPTT